MFIISLWILWKWRNTAIFNGIKSPFMENFFNIVASFEGLLQKPLKLKKDVCLDLSMELSAFPTCGYGFLIMVNENFHFSIHWNGKGSNSKAEVMVVAGFAKILSFPWYSGCHSFWDSKVMVDFVSRKNHILIPHFVGWLDRIRSSGNVWLEDQFTTSVGIKIHRLTLCPKWVFNQLQVFGFCRSLPKGKLSYSRFFSPWFLVVNALFHRLLLVSLWSYVAASWSCSSRFSFYVRPKHM